MFQDESSRKKAEEANGWLRNFFAGEDVFILGGGKSADELSRQTISKLKKARTIVLNKKIELIENPSILMTLDEGLGDSIGKPGNWPYGEPYKVLAGPLSRMVPMDNVYRFQQCHDLISRNPAYLLCDHLGLAAINAAMIGKAKRIFLVGVDCGYGLLSKSGPAPLMNDPALRAFRKYARSIPLFRKFAKFENLYRVTDKTNLDFLPFMDLEVALAVAGKKN